MTVRRTMHGEVAVRRRVREAGWLWLCIAAVAGCDDGGPPARLGDGAPEDARPEPAVDAARDGGRPVDAGPVDPDAEAATVDAARDAGPEPALDAAPDPDPDPGPDAGPPVVHPDPAVFDPDHLIVVDLQIDPADWDALRAQSRGDLDFARHDCLDAPFPSPYDWFPARVVIDGVAYDDIGVRKKGFYGSVSGTRPSVKIRFDKYVDGQSHRGLTRLTLNNGRQDATRLRTCLAYGVFARLGVPAPRCSFARLTVNGADLGVYAHVESIERPFLADHFGDPDGWLYEGQLSDFRPGWRGTIQQKSREDAPHGAGIDRVIAALEAPDETLLEALDDALDLDAFFTFWAAEALLGHWDGYAGNNNNFWFYEHPADGRLRFVPWGPDSTFQPPYLFFENRLGPHSVFANGAIAHRLYGHPEGRARYIDRMNALLGQWDPAGLHAEIDRMQALIDPALRPGERRTQAEAVVELRRYIDAKGPAIRGEIDAGGAGWDLPLRDSLCTEPIGILRGTFETTWGAWPSENVFESGGGTFEGNYRGDARVAAGVGAAAGTGDQGEAILISSQLFADGTITFVYIAADRARFAPGELLLDEGVACVFSVLDRATGAVTRLATCETGQVIFEAVAQAPGAPVRGSFRLGLWGRP